MTRTARRTALWLLLPALALLALVYVVPMLSVVQMAFRDPSTIGITDGAFSPDSLLRAVGDPYYWRIIATTATMGAYVAVLTTVLAYPLSLLITLSGPRARNTLIILAIAPMLISSVARTFGWVVLLGNQGVINTILAALGVARPIPFIGSMGGIVVALTEIFLPYAVLAMVSGFGRISPPLIAAARTLGARPFDAFRRITLPLSLPGVILSLLLVFVLSLGAYVTPRVLGGGRIFVLATEIYSEANVSLNWPLASALSLTLLVLFGAITGISALLRRRLTRAGAHR